MKIKFGSLVVEGAGKIGGHQVQRGRYSSHLVTKRSARKRHSRPPTRQQLLVARIASMWQTLTAEQRAEWSRVQYLARIGKFDPKNPAVLNGWVAFLMVNTWRSNFSLPFTLVHGDTDLDASPRWKHSSIMGVYDESKISFWFEYDVEFRFNIEVDPLPYFRIARVYKDRKLPSVNDHRTLWPAPLLSVSQNANYHFSRHPQIANIADWYGISLVFYQIEGGTASDFNGRAVGYNNFVDRFLFQ